ncbi:glycosyltransferase [Providencia rettgeri]|uniref:glycosyltransferase n=1 Tax=Providencia TaxID=586 RepID=UPI001BD63668|nr:MULTISPECIES: glycosyltransferase [Providencia]ELR5117616.1 glycosyltransferase [Providencia rettgeri]
MKKIAIIIPTLSIGGGEKIAIENATDLAENGYNVSIIIPRGRVEYTIPNNISLFIGSSSNLLSDTIFCKNTLNKIKPDTVISYMERANFINVITHSRKKYQKITSIHTVPSVAYKNRNFLNRIFITLTMYLIKKRNLPVVTMSKGIINELSNNYGITNTYLIKNYFTPPQKMISKTQKNDYCNDILFGFIGRLNHVKGCDILIEAIALARTYGIKFNTKFWIIGEGEQKQDLINLSQKLGVSSEIIFFGRRDDIPELLSEIDYLVVPSYVEGFGLVVLEGLYYGCSIIYSKCKYGPSEIMNNAININDSFQFTDPSQNRQSAINELSLIIKNINKKKQSDSLKSKREYVMNNYNKKSSIQKLISLIEGNTK